MHPRVGGEIIIKGSKAQPTRLRQLQKGMVDFKRSIAKAIVPSDGTQPPARLRKDGALPCKVVITPTHALH